MSIASSTILLVKSGMDMEAGQFSVLLAEDDSISRIFLCEAIRACGGDVHACATGAQVLAEARTGHWDLLILDHRLPGMDGDIVLRTLRNDPDATGHLVPAIATTAAPAAWTTALLAAGFAEVLAKPLTLATMGAALERYGCRPWPLDDGRALSACGSPSAVLHLRRLFAEQELPRIQYEFERHGTDHQALRPTLHRLRASCGFCGATSLARASEALHHALALDADQREIDAALRKFAEALHETRAALRAALDDTG